MQRNRRPTRRLSAIAALPVGAALLVLTACDPDDCTGTSIGSGYTCTISGGGDSSPIPPPTFPAFGGGTGGDSIPSLGGGGGQAIIVGKSGLGTGVVAKVDEVLREDCKSLVSPVNPPYHDPQAVWDVAPVQYSSTPKAGTPEALADAPVGVGAAGPMTIYPPFFSTPPESIFSFIPAHNGLTRLPSDDEMKAMTVLHEIAHLTGALSHDQAGSNQFNLLILEKCFGIQPIPV
jgi:hypothetical protein